MLFCEEKGWEDTLHKIKFKVDNFYFWWVCVDFEEDFFEYLVSLNCSLRVGQH